MKLLFCFPLLKVQVIWFWGISFSSGYQNVYRDCWYLLFPQSCIVFYHTEAVFDLSSTNSKPWWLSGKIKMQLAKIYHAKGILEDFAETIFSFIRETLLVESMNRKVSLWIISFQYVHAHAHKDRRHSLSWSVCCRIRWELNMKFVFLLLYVFGR